MLHSMKEHKLYLDILDQKRKEMLPKMVFLRKEFGFYCAGGTALALQIRHRTSVDFDFYTRRNFDPNTLYKRLA